MKWQIPTSIAISLWIAAALQQALAPRVGIFGCTPDFLLVVVASYSMFLTRSGGAVVGFFAGAIFGAIDFANITAYVASRTCGGFACGWSNDLNIKGGPLVAAATVGLTTVFARLVYMFLAPPAVLVPFLGATIRTAVYNGVLAVPMYLLVKRLMGPSR